ncbi:MAG TPA: ABC transporter permease [Thermoanaerobaculia bacterium]|nr:ABC transporter permease [Thermoanaerobaculia bacterium]
MKIVRALVPFSALALLLVVWQCGVLLARTHLVPGPWAVLLAMLELARRGLLIKYVVASLYRVTWGYISAVVVGIPVGVVLGLHKRGELAFNPLIQILRPISPLAWIPISILWFGVGDVASIFLIFLASFFPLVVTAMNAVHNVDAVYLNAGRNFGLSQRELIRRIIYPAIMPQIIVGLRITLGVAWLVVVAAEMIAVSSGLGFLIVDARNAGDRYDLVMAGMVLIGIIGILLDVMMRQLERLKSIRWGYAS